MYRFANRKTDQDFLEALCHEEAQEPEVDRDEHRRLGEVLLAEIVQTYGSTSAWIAEGIADLAKTEVQERAVMLAIHRQMGNQVALEIRAALCLYRGETGAIEEMGPEIDPTPDGSAEEDGQ